MKALVLQEKEHIQLIEIEDPKIEAATDVIVKVKACAICGSDLHPYHGREEGIDHDCAMGHEFTGEVVEIGKEVKKLRVGDRVMSPFTTSCGQCYYCKSGLTSRCEVGQLFGWRTNGQGLHGGQAEYIRVPIADYTLVNVPDGVNHKLALLLGDILSTGYFCALQAGISADQVQAVVGCGPVGLMTIWGAIQQGATQLYAIDNIPERLALAKQWGAIPINFKEQNPVEVLKEATNGRGADAVMEAVGAEGAVKSAFDLLRPGGTLSAVGVCTSKYLPFSPEDAYNKNITYRIGRCPARHVMESIIDKAIQDTNQLTAVFTHEMPLENGAEGYDIFANKKDNCLKVLLT